MLPVKPVTPLFKQLTSIRDSLTVINSELVVLGYTTKEISGSTCKLSQMIMFNIGSLDKIIDNLNEPKNEVKTNDDFGLFQYMTIAERTEYDQISGLRHQVIAQWRLVENRKWELLKTVRDRLKSQGQSTNNIQIEF